MALKRLVKSFFYAFTGLKKVYKEEKNFRIHLLVALLVLLLAVYLQVALWEWMILLLLISFVLILEILNSIFERIIDILKPRIHQYVKDIKDMGASIVFLGALISVIIGIMIFLPHIIDKFFKY